MHFTGRMPVDALASARPHGCVRAAVIGLLAIAAATSSCGGQSCTLKKCSMYGGLDIAVLEPDGSTPKALSGNVRQGASVISVSCPGLGCTPTGLALGSESGMATAYVDLHDGSGHGFTGTIAVELHPSSTKGDCEVCPFRTASVAIQ
jgi:hypothetical protein